MDRNNWLELLDMYIDMVEKQDEIIARMSKIISRQAQELQLLRNDELYSDTARTMETERTAKAE